MQKKAYTQAQSIDIAAVLICFSAFLVCLFLFFRNINKELVKNTEDRIAVITFKYRSAQRKFSDGVIWDKLRNNSALYNGDTIRTASASEATVYFENGSALDFHENTLAQIFTKRKEGYVSIQFTRGNLSISTGSDDERVVVESKLGTVSVESKSNLSISLKNSVQKIQVLEGNAEIKSNTSTAVLTSGDVIELSEDPLVLEQPSVIMVEPVQYYRVLNHSDSLTNIVFTWETKNRTDDVKILLNLYTDKRNTHEYSSYDVTNISEKDIALPNGIFYWKLIPIVNGSSAGTRYDSGQVLILDAPSPSVITPKDGTFSFENETPQIRFSWKGNDWVSLYQVEVADNKDMVNPVVVKTSQSESCYVSTVPEGIWYWRVIPVYEITQTDAVYSSEVNSFTVEKIITNKEAVIGTVQKIPASQSKRDDEKIQTDIPSSVYSAPEKLSNNDFSQGSAKWEFWQNKEDGVSSTIDVSAGVFVLKGGSRGANEWSIGLAQSKLNLTRYTMYELSFDASSTNADDIIRAGLQEFGKDIDGDGNAYSFWSVTEIPLSTSLKTYRVTLITKEYDDPGGALVYNLGRTASGTITIDNVSLKETGSWRRTDGEMMYDGDFNFGSIFWEYYQNEGNAKLDFSERNFKLTGGSRGVNQWDIGISQKNMSLTKNSMYELIFKASSTNPGDRIRAGIREYGKDTDGDGDAYTPWASEEFNLTSEEKTYKATLITKHFDNSSAAVFFVLGKTQGNIIIDSISFEKKGIWKMQDEEVVHNGSFDFGSNFWNFDQSEDASSIPDFTSGAFIVSGGGSRGSDEWNTCLRQRNLHLKKYTIYDLSFDASSTNAEDSIRAGLQEYNKDIDGDGNAWTIWSSEKIQLSTKMKNYAVKLIAKEYDNPEGSLIFNLGRTTSGTVIIDNISLKEAGIWKNQSSEILYNGNFDLGSNFWNYNQNEGADAKMDFSSGVFTLSGGPRGVNDWNIGMQQSKLNLTQYSVYELVFKASSTDAGDVIKIGLQEYEKDIDGDTSNFSVWSSEVFKLAGELKTYRARLITREFDDPLGALFIALGGTKGVIKIDAVSLTKTGSWKPRPPEILYNGNFDLGSNFWNTYSDLTKTGGIGDFSDGKFSLREKNRGTEIWSIQLHTDSPSAYKKGVKYMISFEASSTTDDSIELIIGENGVDVNGDGNAYSNWESKFFDVTNTMTVFTLPFEIKGNYSNSYGRLNFCIGNTKGVITIDNVSIKPAE